MAARAEAPDLTEAETRQALEQLDGWVVHSPTAARTAPPERRTGRNPYRAMEEFAAWERAIEAHGVPGLRSTRLQVYRDAPPTRLVKPRF